MTCPQRSPEWFAARLGRLTGSCSGDMLATIRSGEAAARRNLRMRLVCERLTNDSQEDAYISKEMQRGIDMEPVAVGAYEALTGELVRTSGFLAHTELMAGCSLDGHVGDYEGIVELKCPLTATHVRYLRDGKVPSDYLPQLLHNLWITGARWADFVSFDDRLPENLRVFRVRLQRNEAEIAEYVSKATAFLAEVDAETEALLTMSNVAAQLAAAVA